MTSSPAVLVEQRSRVVIVTLNQPDRLNVLGSALIRKMTHTMAEIGAEGSASVVVLAAAGRAWIAGADIREMRDFTADQARAFITALHGLFATIRGMDQLVVAAIDGPCFGAGCELAAVCDLRVAGPRATFGMPEVRVGIPSVIEAAMLVPLVGLGRAADLVYTGDIISAEEAVRWGFVTRLAEEGQQAVAVATELAQRMASYSSAALRLQKGLVRRWYYDEALDRAIKLGIDHFATAYEGPDPREAMSAFLEKREPRFADRYG